MTKSELIALIEANRPKIEDELRDRYAEYIESSYDVEYKIYLWSDGEIEVLETCGNEYLRAKDWEDRELIYIGSVGGTPYDWIDFCSERIPDEPDPFDYDDDDAYESAMDEYHTIRDHLREETNGYIVGSYDPSEDLDRFIENIGQHDIW